MRGRFVFIGDVYIVGYGIVPFLAPVDESRRVSEEMLRKLVVYLKRMRLRGVYVTDGATIYHKLYKEFLVLDGKTPKTLSINDVVKGSEKCGDICYALKKVEPIKVTLRDEYIVFPAVVVYENGYWENLSLAPIKIVEKAETLYNKDLSLIIIKPNENALLQRKFMKDVLRRPTSYFIAKKCGIDLVKKQEEEKEEGDLFSI